MSLHFLKSGLNNDLIEIVEEADQDLGQGPMVENLKGVTEIKMEDSEK